MADQDNNRQIIHIETSFHLTVSLFCLIIADWKSENRFSPEMSFFRPEMYAECGGIGASFVDTGSILW
jgi:hypothetical protein